VEGREAVDDYHQQGEQYPTRAEYDDALKGVTSISMPGARYRIAASVAIFDLLHWIQADFDSSLLVAESK
jgi:hypothetical protein